MFKAIVYCFLIKNLLALYVSNSIDNRHIILILRELVK